jgi:hypothetical protein
MVKAYIQTNAYQRSPQILRPEDVAEPGRPQSRLPTIVRVAYNQAPDG